MTACIIIIVSGPLDLEYPENVSNKTNHFFWGLREMHIADSIAYCWIMITIQIDTVLE